MNKNQITSIQVKSCESLENLLKLDLRYQNLTIILNESFSGMLILKRLYLDHNFINEMEFDAFRGLNSLAYLHLSNNEISTVQSETFNSLNNLKSLFLDCNKMMNDPLTKNNKKFFIIFCKWAIHQKKKKCKFLNFST